MPLALPNLQAQLISVFKSRPQTAAIAASRMAVVYDNYARTGTAGGAPPTLTGSEKSLLEAKLFSVLSNPITSTPAKIAQAWNEGLTVYWTSPPAAFTGGGVVTAYTGGSSLVSGLTTVFANLAGSEESQASQIAQKLDQATKTIAVTFPPPVGVVPLI